jgi:hypothetical protein
VAQLPSGQLHAVLGTAEVPQADSLVQWLRKHAELLQGLDMRLISSIKRGGTKDWAEFITTLATALQDATARGALAGLHSFALKGTAARPGLLHALPAAQLKQLAIEVPKQDALSLTAIAALTSLGSLQLTFLPAELQAFSHHTEVEELLAAQDAALQATSQLLAAGLQQLTELHIGPV